MLPVPHFVSPHLILRCDDKFKLNVAMCGCCRKTGAKHRLTATSLYCCSDKLREEVDSMFDALQAQGQPLSYDSLHMLPYMTR